MKRWLSLVIAALGMFVSGCGESSKITPPDDPTAELRELIAQTPRADEEAEMAALWMCGELVAPESTYVQVREALKRVRREYGGENSKLYNIKFDHIWSRKTLGVRLDQQGSTEYRNGLHFEIDSLTELINGEIIDTGTHTIEGWLAVTIKYPGCLNVDSIESMYSVIPSVDQISHFSRIDGPNVYPWRLSDGRLTLLFRDAWGDCPAGCIENHFWYFRISGGSVEYVGEYILYYTNPIPDWWDEAKVGYERFQGLH